MDRDKIEDLGSECFESFVTRILICQLNKMQDTQLPSRFLQGEKHVSISTTIRIVRQSPLACYKDLGPVFQSETHISISTTISIAQRSLLAR